VSTCLVSKCISVDDYGLITDENDPRLVEVPGVGGPRKLHVCAAAVVRAIQQLWYERTGQIPLLASGWRRPKWGNDYEHYKRDMIAQYGSVKVGRLFQAFRTSHGTGLPWDWGSHGLTPNSKTIKRQRVSLFYFFLCEIAEQREWPCPVENYSVEPFHWQARVTREEWLTPPVWARRGDVL
jgi:hypothetical protein